MCTSLAFKANDFYFCRNMDLDYHFGERVVITPRNYPLTFKHEKTIDTHYAIIGMACVHDDYPLYAEGANEKGLCISALNFPQNAHYEPSPTHGALNLAPYEIIPYILATCATVSEAENKLRSLEIINTPFSDTVGTSELHWHIADKEKSIALEATERGVRIYQNPAGILTNNPPFEFHLLNLKQYSHLNPNMPPKTDFSMGTGAVGLPGDFSSISRFVKLDFLKKHTALPQDENSSIATAFRLMYSVAPIKGCVLTKDGKEHYTTYTCVINATKGIYYFTTSQSLEIASVKLTEKASNLSTLVY